MLSVKASGKALTLSGSPDSPRFAWQRGAGKSKETRFLLPAGDPGKGIRWKPGVSFLPKDRTSGYSLSAISPLLEISPLFSPSALNFPGPMARVPCLSQCNVVHREKLTISFSSSPTVFSFYKNQTTRLLSSPPLQKKKKLCAAKKGCVAKRA